MGLTENVFYIVYKLDQDPGSNITQTHRTKKPRLEEPQKLNNSVNKTFIIQNICS